MLIETHTCLHQDAKLIIQWEQTSVQDRQAASDAASKNRTAACVTLLKSGARRSLLTSAPLRIDANKVALGYDVRDVRRNRSTTYLQGKELTDRSQFCCTPYSSVI